ncbi:DNA-binding protein [Streptomyces sp. SID8382]|nr:DNA-binding protein [Streptomyces sp. SID8382]
MGCPETVTSPRRTESQQRSWRRQLASGHRGVQEKYVVEYRRTSTVQGYEATVIPGLFQIPEYAWCLLLQNAELMRTPRDTEEAVRARVMSSVSFGVIPLGAPLKLTPKHGFWIFDDERVIVETINTELHLESAADVTLYKRVWENLSETAVYGAQAHRLITRARACLSRS